MHFAIVVVAAVVMVVAVAVVVVSHLPGWFSAHKQFDFSEKWKGVPDLRTGLRMDLGTDQQAFFPIEMQFYISAMFVGFPDEIHEEKPSFLDFENNWLRTDGRSDPLIEMRGRI